MKVYGCKVMGFYGREVKESKLDHIPFYFFTFLPFHPFIFI